MQAVDDDDEMGSTSRLPGVVAAVILALVVGLTVGSMLPALWGWTPHIVLSGSMAPAVHAGDVVLASPAGASAADPGKVVVARNPSRPGQILLHRVVSVDPDGSVHLKGDANTTTDSTPVPPRDIIGVPRLRVPYVGLPVLWAQQRQWGPLGAAFIFLGGVTLTAVRGLSAGHDDRDEPDPAEELDERDDAADGARAATAPWSPSAGAVDVLPSSAPAPRHVARRGLGEEELRRWAQDPHALSMTAQEPSWTATEGDEQEHLTTP